MRLEIAADEGWDTAWFLRERKTLPRQKFTVGHLHFVDR